MKYDNLFPEHELRAEVVSKSLNAFVLKKIQKNFNLLFLFLQGHNFFLVSNSLLSLLCPFCISVILDEDTFRISGSITD